ncbi:MAG: hypothetical protein U0746_10960 [Gemmataceae bacterium]
MPAGATHRIGTVYRQPRFHRLAAAALVTALALAAVSPAAPPPRPVATLAETFSWSEFVKFWKKQLGKTSGIFGTVFMVGAGAFLIILSKGRKL